MTASFARQVRAVVPGLWRVRLGMVNAYLLDDGDLTLVDTGMPGSEKAIFAAFAALGRRPEELRRIIVTHAHADHSGGLAALKRATRAEALMHASDAALVRRGVSSRPLTPSPGPFPWFLARLLLRGAPQTIEPHEIERELADGSVIPGTGGLTVVHAPGHCAGQVALFWPRHGGVLFAADAASNLSGLGLSLVYEDLSEGRRTLARLGRLDFDVAVFGHGAPIRSDASARFRARWRCP